MADLLTLLIQRTYQRISIGSKTPSTGEYRRDIISIAQINYVPKIL